MRPLIKVPFKYGAIAGLLGAILVIGLYYIGRHPFLIPVFLDFRVFLFGIFIFFILKELRDYWYGGILYFWQGVLGSLLFTVMFALIAAGFLWIFIWFVPDFLQSYIDQSLEQLKLLPEEVIARIGKAVYQRNLEMLPATNGFDLALLYFMQSFMISFFISIILSVILRRQPKT
jgi:hypothetical protein